MIYVQIWNLFAGGMISGIAAYRGIYDENPPVSLPYLRAGGLLLAGLAAIGILT